RRATSPSCTGSPLVAKTMGILVVAAFAASAGRSPPITAITALAVNQFGRQCGQLIVLIVRPAVFDRCVLALVVAGFLEALPKRRHMCGVYLCRWAAKERRERPRGRRAAEKRDELAPFHCPSAPVLSRMKGIARLVRLHSGIF